MEDAPVPYVPMWIEHGSQRVRTERPRVQSRSREIDTGTVSYQDERPDAYPIGSYIDGYPNMPIVESDPRPDGPVYQYRLQFEGLKTEVWRELNYEENLPEENFDTINVTIYTRDPANERWRKGALPTGTDLVGITGSATDSKLTYNGHGLITGQICTVTFGAGFGGLATGGTYYARRIDANQFYLATSRANALAGTVITLTSDGTDMTLQYVPVGSEMCWIVERRKRKARANGYWEIDLQYKGIKLGDDDSKPVKRRISTTTQTVSNDKFPGAILSPVYLGFPPALVGTSLVGPPIPPGYQPTELDLPQIAVTDTFISDQPPPTSLVPGNWIPADAPSITIISPFSDEYTYHWPAGWKVLNLQSEQIPGKPLWFISITWGYQIPASPRTASA